MPRAALEGGARCAHACLYVPSPRTYMAHGTQTCSQRRRHGSLWVGGTPRRMVARALSDARAHMSLLVPCPQDLSCIALGPDGEFHATVYWGSRFANHNCFEHSGDVKVCLAARPVPTCCASSSGKYWNGRTTQEEGGGGRPWNPNPPQPQRAQVGAGVGKPPHGLGVCIWMHLVNGTGNSPVSGMADPRSSQTAQVIRGLR